MAQPPPSGEFEASSSSQATTTSTSTSSSHDTTLIFRRQVPQNRLISPPPRADEIVQVTLDSDLDDEGNPDSPVPNTTSDSLPWRWRIQRSRAQINGGLGRSRGIPPMFRRCDSGRICPICDESPSADQGLGAQNESVPNGLISPVTSQASTLTGGSSGYMASNEDALSTETLLGRQDPPFQRSGAIRRQNQRKQMDEVAQNLLFCFILIAVAIMYFVVFLRVKS
jgi:hypothetical protein